MHNVFCDLTQKAAEIACDNLISPCTNNIFNRLAGLLEPSPECDTFTNAICDTFVIECPKVWLRQYALPILVTGGAILAAMMFCRARPR